MTKEQIDRLFADLMFACGHGPVGSCRRCTAEKTLRALLDAPPPSPPETPAPRGTTEPRCTTCGDTGWIMTYDQIEPGISAPAGEPCPDCDGPPAAPETPATEGDGDGALPLHPEHQGVTTMTTSTTHWVMPDGSHRFETTEECPDCGHHHTPTWGGICVGCPCPNIRTEEAPVSPPSGSGKETT